jgi:nickel transport system substrate-binding protein
MIRFLAIAIRIIFFLGLLNLRFGVVSHLLCENAWASSKTLNYSWVCNVGPLNPHDYSPNQMFAQAMVYEPLVRYGAHDEILPCLAESWDISPDGLEYVFHLRKNVFFSDGAPFNAKAVKQNHDAILMNAKEHGWLGLIHQVRNTVIVDDHTFKLVLKSSYYPVLDDLTLVRPFRYLSPTAFPKSGNTAEGITAPIGTGPWKLIESKLGEYDIFERNENYWGPIPDIDRIVVKVISDPNTRAVAFETGEIDLIYGDDQVTLDTFDRFRANRRYTTKVSKPLSTRAIAINSNRGPTKDLAVRRAILHAVNKDAIVKGIFLNTELKADSIFSPQVPYCDLKLAPYAYDPEKADTILASAGWMKTGDQSYRKKNGKRLSVDLCFVGNNVIEKSIAEVVQADLQKIGIQVKLNGVEEDMYYRKRKEGDFELIFNDTWGPPYEPHAYCSAMRSPSIADFQAQAGLPMKTEIDAKIGRAIVSVDENERRELFGDVMTTLHDQAVYLPISHTTGLLVHGSHLTGVDYGPTKYEIPFEKMIKQ